jgi:hypothetical protein
VTSLTGIGELDRQVTLNFSGSGDFTSGKMKPLSISLIFGNENRLNADLSAPGVPATQVEVSGNQVRLHWESKEGVPMQKLDTQTGQIIPFSGMIYQIEVEGNFLPLVTIYETWY